MTEFVGQATKCHVIKPNDFNNHIFWTKQQRVFIFAIPCGKCGRHNLDVKVLRVPWAFRWFTSQMELKVWNGDYNRKLIILINTNNPEILAWVLDPENTGTSGMRRWGRTVSTSFPNLGQPRAMDPYPLSSGPSFRPRSQPWTGASVSHVHPLPLVYFSPLCHL